MWFGAPGGNELTAGLDDFIGLLQVNDSVIPQFYDSTKSFYYIAMCVEARTGG